MLSRWGIEWPPLNPRQARSRDGSSSSCFSFLILWLLSLRNCQMYCTYDPTPTNNHRTRWRSTQTRGIERNGTSCRSSSQSSSLPSTWKTPESRAPSDEMRSVGTWVLMSLIHIQPLDLGLDCKLRAMVYSHPLCKRTCKRMLPRFNPWTPKKKKTQCRGRRWLHEGTYAKNLGNSARSP